MAKKIDATQDYLESALGRGGSVEIVPIFMPVQTFKFISDEASKCGDNFSDFLSKSVMFYINNKNAVQAAAEEKAKPVRPEPAIVVKRRPR